MTTLLLAMMHLTMLLLTSVIWMSGMQWLTIYSKRYLDLVRDNYRVIWWKLQSADSKKWSNILVLIELYSMDVLRDYSLI